MSLITVVTVMLAMTASYLEFTGLLASLVKYSTVHRYIVYKVHVHV